jgi:uncharacterized protein (DUF885 family)
VRRLIIVTAILALAVSASAADEATTKLNQLISDRWQYELSDNPLAATAYGDHRFNDRLPSVALDAYEAREREARRYLTLLGEIDPGELGWQADRVNHAMFERLLQEEVAGYEFRSHLMPITNRSGFHVAFPRLPDRVPLKSNKDYEDYISRLEGFKVYADEHIELLEEGMRTGRVLPRIVLEGWESAVTAHIVDDPEESLLYAPFEDRPGSVSASDWDGLRARARDAIAGSVVPGYQALYGFMEEKYVPAARETIGASDLPDGKEWYEHLVRRHTTLDVSPREVHDSGLAEVARIRAEMQEVIDGVGFQGTFAEFVEFLRTDDQFYVDTPEQLMKEASLVLKKMDGELPRLFKTLPRMPYGIKRVPDYIAPRTTTAYYDPPAGDGSRAGYYFVNCYDLTSRPLYEVEALSLHEAVPGHHLQVAIALELENVPAFRRFGWVTAFGEGWALYAERLGLETGFYQDPYSNFGRLTYEMWRACRLVVDTGIHYFGWTRQQAIDFMADNSALTLHNITTEVDRYISWPGQALGYKIGELKIRELRARAEGQLGDSFDIREFHDVVLGSGCVPLDILESNVDAWIKAATQ